MTRPKLLDLFCGAGGCSVGYHRAGFDVTGVDHEFHEGYPDPSLSLLGPVLPDVDLTFVQADALDVLRDRAYLDSFDVVALSPPCPGYSTITPDQSRHPRLIEPCRELLEAWGGVYVIENVEGAANHMRRPVRYCGSSFGLAVRRHRLFESNRPIVAPDCDHAAQGRPTGVYGDHAQDDEYYRRPDGTRRGNKAKNLAEGRAAMGIEWMTWLDLVDAVPPAYTEHIGRQLVESLAIA